ncbi:hypothetical protein [Nocardia sp. BMG111209]
MRVTDAGRGPKARQMAIPVSRIASSMPTWRRVAERMPSAPITRS